MLAVFLSACRSAMATSTSIPDTATPLPTETPLPSPTPTPTATTIPLTATPTPQVYEICSPLEDETFNTLPLILVNPLNIPPFGQDVGHHGVDFSYFQRGERESIEGIEVYAILSGQTVMILDDHYPYGYAILIEPPLTDLPESLTEKLMTRYIPVPEDPHYRLDCPKVTPPALTGEYAIYHLYAHLEAQPPFDSGDPVPCGTTLGTVGNTGYSSNPHLHLETRLGPAGADFQTMAHYENTATVEQMGAYCLWRMSGYYQLFDPFLLIDGAE